MLREGRFEKSMDPDAAEFSNSLRDDLRIFGAVVEINVAHMKMLKECEILEAKDANPVISALLKLHGKDPESLEMPPEMEDIHVVIEEYVRDEVGEEVGGKLHTAKSRNDQVSTGIRMVIRGEIIQIQRLLIDFIRALIGLAEENVETVMPGYTHLQVAEPTTFGHYLCAYGHMFLRDLERLENTYEQTNTCPLGACALAGTSFPIDRELTGNLLGFDGILENSIDATGSRDFGLKLMSDLAIMMSNFSRISEELCILSSVEFDMVEMPDEFSSTSSIMPQKKNPIIPEMARAKSGGALGNFVAGMVMMKGLPQAYNLDLQELTPLIWDSVDDAKSSLKVMGKMIEKLEPNSERMRESAEEGFACSTELANMLVREGNIPFRKAHSIVGYLTHKALGEGKSLGDLNIEDLYQASEDILGSKVEVSEESFEEALDLDATVRNREMMGGPSSKSVIDEISGLEGNLKSREEKVERRKKMLSEAEEKLLKFQGGK